MNFGLTEKQRLFRERVRDFAEREVKPVAAINDEQEKFDVELTKKMADLGLLGICVPEEYGGCPSLSSASPPTSAPSPAPSGFPPVRLRCL